MSEKIKPFQVQHESFNYDLTRLEKKVNGIYNKFLKRIIGLILALFIFVVLLPFFIAVSIAIIIDSGFPIFYRGERGGLNGRTFKIYKFRTMVKNADKIGGGTTALNDSRITKVGHILRKTKLDEFPQIFNILKGEMCFIGPRPELIRYTSQYDGAEEYILKVRPGITDISSIEFINLDEVVGSQNADEMYEKYVLKRKNHLRIKYAEKISLLLDIKLFYLTVIRTANKMLKVILKTEVKGGKGAA
ncbi:lipopolysaccharide/colanic/teichoic acid biosynthesis glycosyltransferase [Bacillus niacini]|uniref:Lipopolysaccharide/colanic/teichoic acid biosynthesis glycosyltransferase n=1 Tax=Neobacillus niacini TaxID=86668 RepID=A0A852T564_9BACI|nr:sugar transferase [Neobacillus niacini]NYE03850.1 lipopolysaccharide/colanic/teichoic acid biosynthesis glycosyltransferase [Neobacillus niacini]